MNTEATCVPARRLLLAGLALVQLLLAPCAMALAGDLGQDCEHCAAGDTACLGGAPAPSQADEGPVPGRARAPGGPMPTLVPAPHWHLLAAGAEAMADDACPAADPGRCRGAPPLILLLGRLLI